MSSPMDSTRGLIRRAQNGDLEAREKLWKRVRDRLHRLAHGRLPRHARGLVETDDVVQEALAHTFRRIDFFDPKHSGAFNKVLQLTVDRCLVDQHRRAKRRPSANETATDLVAQEPSAIEEAIKKETLEQVMSARDRLSPEDQALLHARLDLQLDWNEVALFCRKASSDAARVGVRRAIVRLIKLMVP